MRRRTRFQPRLESLELRQLCASDLLASSDLLADNSLAQAPHADAPPANLSLAGHAGRIPVSDLTTGPIEAGEGEASQQPNASDLVAFARALSESGTVFYGAIWCTFCNQQKALFEDGAAELPFVEVTNPDRTLNSIGVENNISSFPTWVFPDQSRATGLISLATLSQRANVPIPQNNKPSFAPIDDQEVMAGSTLWLPLDGYDPNGDPLTYSVTVANPTVISTDIPLNNRSLKIDYKSWGTMTFELFDHLVPDVTNHIADLAANGFYNPSATAGTKTLVDRVIDSPSLTMIQMGSPTGGNSPVTAAMVDDQFDVRLQHTSAGLLSLIKPDGDDTGSSRFGILGAPARQLDFDNPIFGRLVEGDSIREGMNITAATDNIPNREIQINSVSTVIDRENRLLMLRAPVNGSGSTNVTVTVSDGAGHSYQQTFQVTVTPSDFNGSPFLGKIYDVGLGRDQPFTWNLTGGDAENDPTYYAATLIGPGDVAIDQQTGVLTYTPELGFAGEVFIDLIAEQDPTVVPTTDDPFDRQSIRLTYVDRVHAWSNDFNPTDIDGDGVVAPLDALLIINEVNQRTFSDALGKLPLIRPDNISPQRWLDVNDDGFVVPLDAIIVINELNEASGEGEGTDVIVPVPVTPTQSLARLGDLLPSTTMAARLVDEVYSEQAAESLLPPRSQLLAVPVPVPVTTSTRSRLTSPMARTAQSVAAQTVAAQSLAGQSVVALATSFDQ